MTLGQFKKLSPSQQLEYYSTIKKEKDDHYNLMVHRCQQDTRINILLWEDLKAKLDLMYKDNPQDKIRLVKLLNWIMDCSYMQEKQGIKVDVKKTEENLAYFEALKEEKISQLKERFLSYFVKFCRFMKFYLIFD